MRKQQDRLSNGNESHSRRSQALKGTPITNSKQVQHEAGEDSKSPEGAVELIRAQAYRLFELRGRQPGHELDDWLLAEREILRAAPSPASRRFTGIC